MSCRQWHLLLVIQWFNIEVCSWSLSTNSNEDFFVCLSKAFSIWSIMWSDTPVPNFSRIAYLFRINVGNTQGNMRICRKCTVNIDCLKCWSSDLGGSGSLADSLQIFPEIIWMVETREWELDLEIIIILICCFIDWCVKWFDGSSCSCSIYHSKVDSQFIFWPF